MAAGVVFGRKGGPVIVHAVRVIIAAPCFEAQKLPASIEVPLKRRAGKNSERISALQNGDGRPLPSPQDISHNWDAGERRGQFVVAGEGEPVSRVPIR